MQVSEDLLDPQSGVTLEKVLLEELDKEERDDIIGYAVALARSSQASSLPGYFIG